MQPLTGFDQHSGIGRLRKRIFQPQYARWPLAHTVKNKAEAAYLRTDLFVKRRELMENWSQYATTTLAQEIRLSA